MIPQDIVQYIKDIFLYFKDAINLTKVSHSNFHQKPTRLNFESNQEFNFDCDFLHSFNYCFNHFSFFQLIMIFIHIHRQFM